jgi:hypothetical protein
MKVVNPEDTDHIIDLIPRYYPIKGLYFSLFNEATKETENIDNTYTITDGVLFLSFEYTFTENQKFQIKLSEDTEIVYRGKLIATSQTPQDYKLTNNVYFY